MSNELSVVSRNTFLAISNAPEAMAQLEAIRENMEGDRFRDSDLTRVKNPAGGSLTFEIATVDGVQAVPKIRGVIVFRCKQGVLWPTENTGDKKPVLISNDLEIGRLMVPWNEVPEDIQEGILASELTEDEIRRDARFRGLPKDQLPRLFWWNGPKAIPYTQFGTSTKGDGRGKRAKEYQVLYVLREEDVMPIKLRMGPTSIRPMRDYMVGMRDMKYNRAITEISLQAKDLVTKEGKQKYSVAVFKRVGALDPEAAEIIEKQFTQLLKEEYEAGMITVDAEDGE